MAKYYCTCGQKLKPAKKKGVTGTKKGISYKVFTVTTTTRYKCPNGCELKEVVIFK